MMELIYKEELVKYINSVSTHILNEWDTLGVLDAIEKQKSIDAVPIVRCKDCRYWNEAGRGCEINSAVFNGHRIGWESGDYCSLGERKDDAE